MTKKRIPALLAAIALIASFTLSASAEAVEIKADNFNQYNWDGKPMEIEDGALISTSPVWAMAEYKEPPAEHFSAQIDIISAGTANDGKGAVWGGIFWDAANLDRFANGDNGLKGYCVFIESTINDGNLYMEVAKYNSVYRGHLMLDGDTNYRYCSEGFMSKVTGPYTITLRLEVKGDLVKAVASVKDHPEITTGVVTFNKKAPTAEQNDTSTVPSGGTVALRDQVNIEGKRMENFILINNPSGEDSLFSEPVQTTVPDNTVASENDTASSSTAEATQTSSENSSEETTSSAVVEDEKDDNTASNLWWVWLIVVAAALLIGGAVIFVVKKKKTT